MYVKVLFLKIWRVRKNNKHKQLGKECVTLSSEIKTGKNSSIFDIWGFSQKYFENMAPLKKEFRAAIDF